MFSLGAVPFSALPRDAPRSRLGSSQSLRRPASPLAYRPPRARRAELARSHAASSLFRRARSLRVPRRRVPFGNRQPRIRARFARESRRSAAPNRGSHPRLTPPRRLDDAREHHVARAAPPCARRAFPATAPRTPPAAPGCRSCASSSLTTPPSRLRRSRSSPPRETETETTTTKTPSSGLSSGASSAATSTRTAPGAWTTRASRRRPSPRTSGTRGCTTSSARRRGGGEPRGARRRSRLQRSFAHPPPLAHQRDGRHAPLLRAHPRVPVRPRDRAREAPRPDRRDASDLARVYPLQVQGDSRGSRRARGVCRIRLRAEASVRARPQAFVLPAPVLAHARFGSGDGFFFERDSGASVRRAEAPLVAVGRAGQVEAA